MTTAGTKKLDEATASALARGAIVAGATVLELREVAV